jgi:K+-transporting ATPase ATPase C chain
MRGIMKKNLITAILYTVVTTALLGIGYPLLVTALAQVHLSDRANGSLITRGGKVIGSKLIAQPFTGPGYFHPRPSVAGGNGYDAGASAASNLGPTNRKLLDRVQTDVAALQQENSGKVVPIDAVTTSASGLDPHITPSNAEFQVPHVAKTRGISVAEVLALVQAHTEPRQLGFLGEPRVNVLELNLALDQKYPLPAKR